VALHGLFSNCELGCNRFVRVPARDQSEHTSTSRAVKSSSAARSATCAAISGVFAFVRHGQHGWSQGVLYAPAPPTPKPGRGPSGLATPERRPSMSSGL
jgi:hypothetical protein